MPAIAERERMAEEEVKAPVTTDPPPPPPPTAEEKSDDSKALVVVESKSSVSVSLAVGMVYFPLICSIVGVILFFWTIIHFEFLFLSSISLNIYFFIF